jgi:hypothetical protein
LSIGIWRRRGRAFWDVAWAVYRFVPLYDDETCARLGYPVRSRGARLRIFCNAYGLDTREALPATVCERIRVLYNTARAWGEDGRPGWREVWRDTRGEQWLAGLRYVEGPTTPMGARTRNSLVARPG